MQFSITTADSKGHTFNKCQVWGEGRGRGDRDCTQSILYHLSKEIIWFTNYLVIWTYLGCKLILGLRVNWIPVPFLVWFWYFYQYSYILEQYYPERCHNHCFNFLIILGCIIFNYLLRSSFCFLGCLEVTWSNETSGVVRCAVVFVANNNTNQTKVVLSCFGLLVGLWQ